MRTRWRTRWTAAGRLIALLVAVAALAFLVYDAQTSSRAADPSDDQAAAASAEGLAKPDVRQSFRDRPEPLYLPTSKTGRALSRAQAERLLRAAGELVDEEAGEGPEQPASPSGQER